MLDQKFIRKNPEIVAQALKARGHDADVNEFLKMDESRRSILSQVEDLKNQRNTMTKQVGGLMQQGKKDEAEAIKDQVREIGAKIKAMDEELAVVDEALTNWIMGIPNIPHASVPVGADENDNPVIRVWGEKPVMDFEPKPHWELGENLGIIDFERASKLAGARFAALSGPAARMERALINFMLDIHTQEHGYREWLPPFMVNSKTMTGTGQLPKFAEDLFKLEGLDYWLIPTAEVPITNLHADETLTEADLPIKYTAYTPCFRAEAGSYGRDTRGLIRQHQFDKVEMVMFSKPEDSYDNLEILTANAEEILKRLDLPYRVVTLCTGDVGFSAAKTYDLEVWLPAADTYREISSCSNFEDFQARRAGIRYKPAQGKGTRLVHTLNGSGLAVGRTMVAIMENYQQADGRIMVPQALRPYMGGMEYIEAC